MKSNKFTSALLAFSISAGAASANDLTHVAKSDMNITNVTSSISQDAMAQSRGINNAILQASQCSSTKPPVSLKKKLQKA